MTDEDQERFEDYIALESYIEALQAGNIAHPPTNLTREQARIYHMAILFNTSTNEQAEPRPEFVEQLKTQLLEANQQSQTPQPEPIQSQQASEQPIPMEEATESPTIHRGTPTMAHFFSRRGLLTGGAIAAASLLMGTGIGYEIEQEQQPAQTSLPPPASNPGATSQPLQISQDRPTKWHFVTTLADLGNTAVRFTSDSIIGYVIRTTSATDANKSEDTVIALSAACTHMGCLVQWSKTERQFACPCHGALFDAHGTQKRTGYPYALSPLPSLTTKIEQGKVYVEVPS